VLTQLFNFIIPSSTVLLAWKISNVVPILKVSSPTERSDYRPISILPVLAKALENVMFEQMAGYVNRDNLISPFQSDFKPRHRTLTALVRVSDDIRLNLELNQPTIFVLLDFSKAFDSVCHGMFILKLHQRCMAFIPRRRRLFHLMFFLGIRGSVVMTIFLYWPTSGWCC
jgi:hypothetical protein